MNAVDGGGGTALMRASLPGHLEVLDLLQSKGADTAATDNDGETALDIARHYNHHNVVHLLDSKPLPRTFPSLTPSTAIIPRRRRTHAAVMTFLMCARRVDQIKHDPARRGRVPVRDAGGRRLGCARPGLSPRPATAAPQMKAPFLSSPPRALFLNAGLYRGAAVGLRGRRAATDGSPVVAAPAAHAGHERPQPLAAARL